MMPQIQKSEKQIVIKSNSMFLVICLGAIFMFFEGASLLFEMLSFVSEFETSDIFGLIFMLIWISVVSWMGIYSLLIYSKKIIIDENGITCATVFKKRHYKWTEIKDYGLSYSGQVRGGGNTYDLYFSSKVQKVRNECSKRLKGNLIKIYVFGTDYLNVTENVFPFCKQYTELEPFTGVDKYHFM